MEHTKYTVERLSTGDWAVVRWNGNLKIEDHIFQSQTVEDVDTGKRAKEFLAQCERVQSLEAELVRKAS